MSDDSSRRSRRAVFAIGCLIGIGVGTTIIYLLLRHGIGTQLVFGGSSQSSRRAVANAPTNTNATEPEHWLRLIQAIGILLPLFTGLLRLTADEQSEVSEDLNTELLFGVTTLVLGGIVAVGGLIAMNTPAVLKLALLFVLLTFGTIGFAAVRIFTEATSGQEDAGSIPSRILLAIIEVGRSIAELKESDSDKDENPSEGGTDSRNETGDGRTRTTENDRDDE